jgi:mycofactocin precursor
VTNIGDEHQTRGADMADNPATELVPDAATEDVVADEVLVEEVSIDGMCGVY